MESSEEQELLKFLESFDFPSEKDVAENMSQLEQFEVPDDWGKDIEQGSSADLELQLYLSDKSPTTTPVDTSVILPLKGVSDLPEDFNKRGRLEKGILQVRDGTVRLSVHDFDFLSTFVTQNPPPRGGALDPYPGRGLLQPLPSTECLLLSQQVAELYLDVSGFNLPNYAGARVKVPNKLNVPLWDSYLVGYFERDLIDFIKFGFPLNYQADKPPTPNHFNHSSANRFPNLLTDFFAAEVAEGALMGPYTSIPFEPWFQVSPLMSRPKKGSSARRFVVDLSYREGTSVNDGVPQKVYEHWERTVVLPSPCDLANFLLTNGPGAYMYSVDLSRFYRQISIDPLDYPLTGLIDANGLYYFDTKCAFGSRAAAYCCMSISTAVCWIYHNLYGKKILAFIDDFAGLAKSKESATRDYNRLIQLLNSLGLSVAANKCTPPTQCLTWIGVQFCSKGMCLKLDSQKVAEVLLLIKHWINTARPVSLKQTQQLLGRLFYSTRCVPGARPFLASTVSFLKSVLGQHPLPLFPSKTLLGDLKWLQMVISCTKGVALIKPPSPIYYLFVDASQSGAGGIVGKLAYICPFPSYFRKIGWHINSLETYNILLAIRLYRLILAGKRVNLYVDNTTALSNMAQGMSTDIFRAECAKEARLLIVENDITVEFIHIPGLKLLTHADALSRAFSDKQFDLKIWKLIDQGVEVVQFPQSLFIPPRVQ